MIVVHRRDQLRATKVYHEPLMRAENVEFRWNRVVEALVAGEDGKLAALKLRDVQTGEISIERVDGAFISIGRAPETKLFAARWSWTEAATSPPMRRRGPRCPGSMQHCP